MNIIHELKILFKRMSSSFLFVFPASPGQSMMVYEYASAALSPALCIHECLYNQTLVDALSTGTGTKCLYCMNIIHELKILFKRMSSSFLFVFAASSGQPWLVYEYAPAALSPALCRGQCGCAVTATGGHALHVWNCNNSHVNVWSKVRDLFTDWV